MSHSSHPADFTAPAQVQYDVEERNHMRRAVTGEFPANLPER